MVNIPKQRKTGCLNCLRHTTHKVSQYKQGKPNPNRQGNRRYRIKQKGFGGQTKPILRRKAKVTKKLVLKLECTVCKRVKNEARSRAKYVVFGGEKKSKGEALVY